MTLQVVQVRQTIEVHITTIDEGEELRHHSYVSAVQRMALRRVR